MDAREKAPKHNRLLVFEPIMIQRMAEARSAAPNAVIE